MSASRTPSPSPSPTSCSLPDLPQVEEQLRQNRHQVGCLRRRSADAATLAATLVERDRVVQQPLQQMGSCCETRSDYGSGSLGRTRSCSLLDLTQPCVTPRGNVKQWDEDQDENDDSFEAVFALIQTGEQQKALEALDDLLASVPSSHPRGLFLKAEILHSLGKNSETIQCLDTFLSISHMKTLYPQALVMKAQALHNLGRYAEANTCFSQYLVHFPDDTAVLSAKGLALFEMGDPESAILSYDATLAISPGDLCALVNRGIALRSTGNHTEAIASFEAALRSCPNHPDILTHKGIELFLLGKHEAALECYEASLLTCPNNPRVLTNKGAALYHLGRHSDAIQCYNAVLEVCPDDHFALNNKGSSLSELGLFEEATKCYDAALQVCPNDSGSLDNKGVALDALGYSTEAIKCFELALVTEKPAKTSKIMYHKGIALYHAGLFSKAVRHFQISMEAAANTSDELLPSSIAKVNSMIALYNLGTASTPNCKQIIQDTLGFTVMPSNSWELTDVSLLEPQNDTGRSDASRKIQGKPIPATCFKKAPFHLPNEEYLLSQLHHGNVLQVDGTTQIGSELYIVTERTSLSLYELVKSKSPPLLTLLQIAWGIAKGMEHLARFNIFYGTLNCSNIYFSSKENLCPKLGDIGLGRLFGISLEQVKAQEWMSCAPEYLRNPLLPRLESDRWSYGMVLWEMWSNCNTPYHDHHISSPCELCDFLESGNRLKINSNWLQQIQQIIKECWDANPFCRPPFSRIQHDLGWVVSTTKQTSSTGTSSLPEGLGDTKQAEKPSFEAHTSETQEPESREITPASCSEPSPGSQNPTEQPRPCGTPSVPPIPNCVEVARNTAEVLPSVSQLYREIAMKMLETAGSKECTQPDNHKRVASRLHLLVVAQQIVLTLVLLLMLIFGSPKAVTVGCVTLLLMTQLFFLSVFYSKNREKDAHKHM